MTVKKKKASAEKKKAAQVAANQAAAVAALTSQVPAPTDPDVKAGGERRQRLRGLMLDAGVAKVICEYDGGGDSGSLETPMFIDEHESYLDLKTLTVEGQETVGSFDQVAGAWSEMTRARLRPAGEEIRDMLYDFLEDRHGGCFNDDGAYGEFAWNVTADEIAWTHNDRYTEVNSFGYEL